VGVGSFTVTTAGELRDRFGRQPRRANGMREDLHAGLIGAGVRVGVSAFDVILAGCVRADEPAGGLRAVTPEDDRVEREIDRLECEFAQLRCEALRGDFGKRFAAGRGLRRTDIDPAGPNDNGGVFPG
jgi:hypothetical protein